MEIIEKQKETGEEAYALWSNRINTALQWRRQNYDTEWQRCYDLYEGLHWRDKDVNEDPRSDEVRNRVTINTLGSSIDKIIPFLINSDLKVHAKPRKPEDVIFAQLQSELVTFEYTTQDMQEEVEKVITDNVIIGHGIGKVTFTLEVDENVNQSDGEINYDDYVKAETTKFERIDPRLFLIDPTAPRYNLQTAQWVAEIYFKPLADVLANKDYDQKVIKEIKAGMHSITRKSTLFGMKSDELKNLGLDSTSNPDSELAVLYEIWDKKFKKVITMIDGCDKPLKEIDNPYPYLPGGCPYIKIDYVYRPNDLYGIGLCLQSEDIQFEKNRRRTYALNHARRFNRKYEVPKGLDEDAKIKLANGEDGTIIESNLPGSIKAIEDAPMSVDYERIEALLDKDFADISGLDALLSGRNLPSRTTGTEVNARTNLFMLKLDGRIKRVNRFLIRLIKHVSAHVSANFTIEKVTKILGEQGQVWYNLNNEEILSQIHWDMEPVNAPKTDPTVERQQKLQIFQTVMNPVVLQFIQAGILKINLNELFKWLLESFEMKDIGRFFQDALIPNTPLQQQPVQNQQQAQLSPTPTQPQDIANQTQGAAITPAASGGTQ